MRAVADSNVVISGLLWGGSSRALLDAARAGRLELCVSPELLAELAEVLERPKFQSRLERAGVEASELVTGFASLATRVIPGSTEVVIAAGPDDDAVLACARAAEAELIVSGDRHLLALGIYRGIKILSPAEAAKLF
jgi:putative PIN family toxin of toxin-antitoxin system